jgi:monoamine oxidase
MKISRNLFLKKSSRLLASGLLVSPFFSSISQTKNIDQKIIIIGAGIAGLYSARLLRDSGFQVTVLEASSTHGGRIRPLLTFSDYPVELGADVILGEKSIYHREIREKNIKFFNTSLAENYFVCNGYLKDESEADSDEKFNRTQKIINDIKFFKGHDLSVDAYLRNKELDEGYKHIAEALVGNEHGTNNNKIGMRSLAKSLNDWKSGKNNYLLFNRSHLSAIEEIVKLKDIKIIYDFPVNKIDYSGKGIIIYDKKGRSVEANKAIITVPISILKNNDIQFNPALPIEKQSAIDRIGIDSGMKIILKFNKRFWGEFTGSIISDGIVPTYSSYGKLKSANNNILTAYISGENANYLSDLGNKATQEILIDLNRIFGNSTASNLISESFIMDWKKEQYIQGCYSYPSLNENNSRDILKKSIKEKLYFAGEATNVNGHFGSIHGAMETGKEAVSEIIKDIN